MRLVRLLASVVAVAFACGSSSAAELIVNGGFETGNFSGWNTQPAGAGSLFLVGGGAHSGSFGAQFGGTSGQADQIWQTFPTAAGQQFTVSFWVNNAGAADDLLLVQWNGATLHYSSPVSFPAGWTRVSVTALAVTNMSELRISAYDSPSYVYIDDVSVQTDNLIVNPSFETGDFTGWNTQAGGASLFGVSGTAHTGGYGAYFAAVNSQYDQIWQTVPTVPGRVYMLQFWLNNDLYVVDSLRVYWEGQLIYDGTLCPLTGGYAPLTFFVTSTGTSSEVRFAGHDDPSAYYIDDIYLGQPGNPACLHDGDADMNGVVEFADITAVLRNWGATCMP